VHLSKQKKKDHKKRKRKKIEEKAGLGEKEKRRDKLFRKDGWFFEKKTTKSEGNREQKIRLQHNLKSKKTLKGKSAAGWGTKTATWGKNRESKTPKKTKGREGSSSPKRGGGKGCRPRKG